jgi:hypothetical protein
MQSHKNLGIIKKQNLLTQKPSLKRKVKPSQRLVAQKSRRLILPAITAVLTVICVG